MGSAWPSEERRAPFFRLVVRHGMEPHLDEAMAKVLWTRPLADAEADCEEDDRRGKGDRF